jgi:tetratricopeptide (TPR) repeat protein
MTSQGSTDTLNRIQGLSNSGRNAAVVAELGALPIQEVEESPGLALLLGIAHGRLGDSHEGKQWVNKALGAERRQGTSAIEARSLNICGAIAFQEGLVDEAARFFGAGLSEAESLGDRATVGRCSNNLGIIANLRGQPAQAVGFHTTAASAFQCAGHRAGIAETLHNLAINYRDQRAFARALESEDRAAAAASAAGDLGLLGLVHCGRGEIRLHTGEVQIGRTEIERALDLHREIEDLGGETEDLRAMAEALELLRHPDQAEEMLRDVIERARGIGRPLLAAQAERDLARLLHRQERDAEAIKLARDARRKFLALGAVSQVGRLDFLLRDLDG